MQNPHEHALDEPATPSPTFSHVIRTLRAYLPIIFLSLVAAAVGYIIVAVVLYLLAPSQRVTTMQFRLEFEGAERGEYPNGVKFSTAEVISTPVLLRVFNANDLKRFTTFTEFTHAVFVLESNAAYEELVREYMARLSDPRLTSVDRERIQREFDLRKASLSKDSYSINYQRGRRTDAIPEMLVRKVLHDILKEWARFVANEQHVLEYRLPVISPDVITNSPVTGNPLIATEMLRAKTNRVLFNITQIRMLPAAEVIRTKDNLTLNDIAFRLEDIMRFTLEPLVHRIAGAGLDERPASIRFLETQLSYDERALAARQQFAEAAQRTLALYEHERATETATTTDVPRTAEGGAASGGQMVVPQVDDDFIDRLMQLTSAANDREYRQALAGAYHEAQMSLIPLQQAVAYDRAVLDVVRNPRGGTDGLSRAMVDQQLTNTRNEVHGLVLKVHEIHRKLSENLNPATELLSVTAAPTTRVQRMVNIKRIALYGILVLSMVLVLASILSLLHARVREDDAAA